MISLKKRFIILIAVISTFLVLNCHGSFTEFSYQGRLEAATGDKSSSVKVQFELYNQKGEREGVTVVKDIILTNGIFSVVIDPAGGDPKIFSQSKLWLRVSILDSAGQEQAILPLQLLSNVPVASYARFGGGFPGEIKAWAGQLKKDGRNNLPPGWLPCNGIPVSSMKYKALFEAIGQAWGDGSMDPNGIHDEDPTTDFNLPDLRGRFLRGVDQQSGNDPDAELRIESNVGGNFGNMVGSIQEDIYGTHNHSITDPGHSHVQSFWACWDGGNGYAPGFRNQAHYPLDFGTSGSSTGIQINDNGGKETRPKNAYIYWIIYTGVME